ncbi:MAG: hypothetical protein RIM72_15415 [Alphaproteobacteria bacterium]
MGKIESDIPVDPPLETVKTDQSSEIRNGELDGPLMLKEPKQIVFVLGAGRASTDAAVAISLQLRAENATMPIYFYYTGRIAYDTAVGHSYVLKEGLRRCGKVKILAHQQRNFGRRVATLFNLLLFFMSLVMHRSLVFIAPRSDTFPMQPIPFLSRLGGGSCSALKSFQAPFNDTMILHWERDNPHRVRPYRFLPDYCVFSHPQQHVFFSKFIETPWKAIGTFHAYPAWRQFCELLVAKQGVMDIDGRHRPVEKGPVFIVLGEERIIPKGYVRPGAARDQMRTTLKILKETAPDATVVIKPHPGFDRAELESLVGEFLSETTFISDAHVALLAKLGDAVFSGAASSAFLNFCFERTPVVETTLYDPVLNPTGRSKVEIKGHVYAKTESEIAAVVHRIVDGNAVDLASDPSDIVHLLTDSLTSQLWIKVA